MTPRLLSIDTCGDCAHFIRTWEGARVVRICTKLGVVVCDWTTPRPPIPDDCPLPKAGDYSQRAGERYG